MHPPDRPRRLALPLLLLATALVWLPVAAAGFVWDDQGLVVGNTLTGSLANLPRFFAIDLWDATTVGEGVSGYYRPLMLVSLAVDRALWGLSAAGHHLHSLGWHLLAVAGAFALLERPLGWRGATLAAGLFALHPVQVEAVTWIAARNDPMAAALGLWALAQVAWREPSRGRQVAAAGLALLAGLAKESVVLLPLLLLLIDWTERRRPRLARHAPLLLGIGAVVAMRAAAGVGGATWPEPLGWRLLAQQAPELVALVGRLLVAPWPLTTGYGLEWLDRLPDWQRLVGLGGLAALSVAAGRAAGRDGRRGLLGPLWLCVALAPVVLPLADKGLFGDRYLYLGVLGLGALVARLAAGRPLVVLAVLAAPCVVLVQLRLPDWVDEATLWDRAVAASPNPYTWGGQGHALREAGQHEAALSRFVQALGDPIPDRSICPQVVGTALALGRPVLAAQLGHWAHTRGCRDGAYIGQYAVALGFAGEWERAAEVVGPPTEDPFDRVAVVRAALRLRAGDAAGAQAALAHAPDPEDALQQARRIVAAAPR